MTEQVRAINENIRYVAALGEKPATTHINSDAAWLARYRAGRDLIRAGGECLGDGSCVQCDRYLQPEEPRMCERYTTLGAALSEYAEINVVSLPETVLPELTTRR